MDIWCDPVEAAPPQATGRIGSHCIEPLCRRLYRAASYAAGSGQCRLLNCSRTCCPQTLEERLCPLLPLLGLFNGCLAAILCPFLQELTEYG
jgi:hypothetical protein